MTGAFIGRELHAKRKIFLNLIISTKGEKPRVEWRERKGRNREPSPMPVLQTETQQRNRAGVSWGCVPDSNSESFPEMERSGRLMKIPYRSAV